MPGRASLTQRLYALILSDSRRVEPKVPTPLANNGLAS
ncbi:hypothetical protein Alg215_12381 [Pyrenophora tritici-repentis]|nr:hypothetical protein Alg215_12381 [Pyrenophora tritici-repentis]